MSTNPIALRHPFESEIAKLPEGIQQAHRFAFNGILDLNQALALLNTKVNSLSSSGGSSSSSSTATMVVSGVSSFNGATGAVSFFPSLGGIQDQTGQTSYTLQQADSGTLLVLNDSSPVAVGLNPAIVKPYFLWAMNLGSGTVTFTPTTPATINYYGNIGATSMPLLPGCMALIQYDGTNWNAATVQVSVTFNAVAHQWLKSYSAVTGQFTATQPDFSDLSGTAAAKQGGTGQDTSAATGVAQVSAGTWSVNTALANGTTATTQSASDNSTKVATTAYVDRSLPLSGVSTSLGGSAMTAGQTISTTVTITGATVGMVAVTCPQTYPGDSFVWDAYVSAADTVTVRLTAVLAGTPTGSIYSVRIFS